MGYKIKNPTSGEKKLGCRLVGKPVAFAHGKSGRRAGLHLKSFTLPSKYSTGRSPGLQLQTYSSRLPTPNGRAVASCDFRSCLQLRGSAGFSPASYPNRDGVGITRVSWRQYNRKNQKRKAKHKLQRMAKGPGEWLAAPEHQPRAHDLQALVFSRLLCAKTPPAKLGTFAKLLQQPVGHQAQDSCAMPILTQENARQQRRQCHGEDDQQGAGQSCGAPGDDRIKRENEHAFP